MLRPSVRHTPRRLSMPPSNHQTGAGQVAHVTIDCATAKAKTDVFALSGTEVDGRAIIIQKDPSNETRRRMATLSELLSSDTKTTTA